MSYIFYIILFSVIICHNSKAFEKIVVTLNLMLKGEQNGIDFCIRNSIYAVHNIIFYNILYNKCKAQKNSAPCFFIRVSLFKKTWCNLLLLVHRFSGFGSFFFVKILKHVIFTICLFHYCRCCKISTEDCKNRNKYCTKYNYCFTLFLAFSTK